MLLCAKTFNPVRSMRVFFLFQLFGRAFVR